MQRAGVVGNGEDSMRARVLIVVAGVAAVIAGFGAFLATWDIPAPAAVVEIVIPNDRFSR